MNSENQKAKLGREFREKVASYITAAFGLVASLAWNDAVPWLVLSQSGFEPIQQFSQQQSIML